MTVPRHCEKRSNPEITGLQERQDLQVFICIASFLAMTNALSVNVLAMTDVSSKPLAGFKTTARV
jgi:hypothetical protein